VDLQLKKIAIIGQPNVGKSSLYNRLLQRRDAIVSEQSGTTRDFKTTRIDIAGKQAELIDTGGLDESSELFSSVHRLSMKKAAESDIILYMVDGRFPPTDEDKKIFYDLQHLNKHLILVVNKIDNNKLQEEAWSFYEFGVDSEIQFISVSHNSGILKLKEYIAQFLPPAQEIETQEEIEELDAVDEEEESSEIRVAIIGRVNVGKSSLLNALLKEERSIVSDIAGTTIDPVNEYTQYNDYTINFVDTAGVRRRGKIEGLEKYALMRTESMLEDADVALLVLDASESFKELDERIANLVDKYALATVIVLNKWDATMEDKEYEDYIDDVRDRFKFLSFAPIITVSALSHKRVEKIYEKIVSVYENYKRRISTSQFNELLRYALSRHQIPSDKGRDTRIYYGTQFSIKPPKFAVVMNRPESLHFSYRRYLVNKIREKFDFEGTPIHISPRKKGQREGNMNLEEE
jgi:GTP-binding protein